MATYESNARLPRSELAPTDSVDHNLRFAQATVTRTRNMIAAPGTYNLKTRRTRRPTAPRAKRFEIAYVGISSGVQIYVRAHAGPIGLGQAGSCAGLLRSSSSNKRWRGTTIRPRIDGRDVSQVTRFSLETSPLKRSKRGWGGAALGAQYYPVRITRTLSEWTESPGSVAEKHLG